ncbi:hypothetical protein ES708_12444 [subsurface metagenome]
MQVRILPGAQTGKELKMERCQEHLVADGQIDRSTKKDGEVVRKRTCSKCHFFIMTIEKTEDKIAHERAVVQNSDRELRSELAFYKRAFENVRKAFQALESIKEDINEEWEIGSENSD